MIVNPEATLAISNMRWVDSGNIWSYAPDEAESRLTRVSDFHWLTLVPGRDGYFAVVHHSEGRDARLSAHSHKNIAEPISSVDLHIDKMGPAEVSETPLVKFAGEASVWSFLPRAYVLHALNNSFLLLLDADKRNVQIQSLSWYAESYDAMYQGIVGATEVPGSSLVIISLQRDSEPVLYDPSTKKVVNKLKLAGRLGNPQLFFRRRTSELWASDYDTLVRLDSLSWQPVSTLRLQEGGNGVERMFIGEYSFSGDESLCVVARPFSGDVVGVGSDAFAVIMRAETGGQPLEVGIFPDHRVVSRDWKTGRLLKGVLSAI